MVKVILKEESKITCEPFERSRSSMGRPMTSPEDLTYLCKRILASRMSRQACRGVKNNHVEGKVTDPLLSDVVE